MGAGYHGNAKLLRPRFMLEVQQLAEGNVAHQQCHRNQEQGIEAAAGGR